ncbi:uncharacterized protein LAESUDRAFT_682844 [Laetiporus sulphureus 93-53]|uniref:Ubiquitin 3 binding protein But2 C-terminal domain-containing protein n=1 Tax=Laetiporus sulphureus 93-53 TaxID=1314785 RepID=A0A165D7L5_9APHY|nr:uncharacterized protein LAESUDRAFT_682844 [Laetiporus sulphureus 93-53]KZT04283.1 hypothetical protein LAESUDRAFT_682844 [Laetiporus sulphureus 93-53]
MHDRSEEVIALLDAGSREEDDTPEKASHARSQSQTIISSLLHGTTGILVLFIVLDLIAFLYVFRSVLALSGPSTDEFEFRNPYIGLDELYASGRVNASRYDPIVNVPRVAAQVSSTEPNKVGVEDEHRYLSNFGTMTPLDRHLQVSSTIHTILQFRTMDYGMESCALALRLPSPEDSESLQLAEGARDVHLDVCALDVSRQLKPRSLSWATRPRCQTHVGTLVAGPGEEVRFPEFPCSWGSLHTYEISCSADSPDCLVDVWATRNGTWGIFMYQYQTV